MKRKARYIWDENVFFYWYWDMAHNVKHNTKVLDIETNNTWKHVSKKLIFAKSNLRLTLDYWNLKATFKHKLRSFYCILVFGARSTLRFKNNTTIASCTRNSQKNQSIFLFERWKVNVLLIVFFFFEKNLSELNNFLLWMVIDNKLHYLDSFDECISLWLKWVFMKLLKYKLK